MKKGFYSFLQIFALATILTSCSNFLQGSDLKKNMDDIINLNNQSNPLKIDFFRPENSSSGTSYGTPIEIHFNQGINRDSLLNNYKIEGNSTDYTEYWKLPEFYSENGISDSLVVITPKEEAKDFFESITILNLSLTLGKDIKSSAEGGPLGLKDVVYSFRINNEKETNVPLILELNLYKNQSNAADKVNAFSTEQITGAVLSEDFLAKNHASSIYVNLKAFDSESGVYAVKILEQQLFSAAGTELQNEPSVQSIKYLSDYSYKTTGPGEIESSLKYVFSDAGTDGLYKLQVSVLDKFNNESGVRTFYVIKDTNININNFKIYNCSKSTNTDKDDYDSWCRKDINDTLREVFIEGTDPIFANYSENQEDLKIRVQAGESEETMQDVECSYKNNKWSFVLDDICKTYNILLSVEISDTAGNTGTTKTYIPSMGKCLSYKKNGNNYNVYYINAATRTRFYCYNSITNNFSDSEKLVWVKDNSIPFGPSPIFTLSTDGSNKNLFIASRQLNINNTVSLSSAVGNFLLLSDEKPTFITDSDKPEYNINFTPGPENSGVYNVKINYPTVPREGITYYLNYNNATNMTPEELINHYNTNRTTNLEFSIKNHCGEYKSYTYYSFMPVAVDSYGNMIKGDITTFECNYDNRPPDTIEDYPHLLPNGEVVYVTTGLSDSGGSGIDTSKGIEYWIVPEQKDWNLPENMRQRYRYSEDFLKQFEKKSIDYTSSYFIQFPLAGLSDGNYELYVKLYDNNGNYFFGHTCSFEVDMLDENEKLKVSLNEGKLQLKIDETNRIPADYTNGDQVYYVSLEYFNKETSRWEYKTTDDYTPLIYGWEYPTKYTMTDSGSIQTCTFDKIDHNSFIKVNVSYFGEMQDYPNYDTFIPSNSCFLYTGANNCTTKKLITSSQGTVLTKSDCPYIVQTLSSPVSYDSDIDKWERYGLRQNCQWMQDTDIYQTKSSDIKPGYYWCIITHWADGDSSISEVWQNQ